MSDVEPRLPQPGGDRGQWGKILNAFLAVEHHDDGTLRRAIEIDNAVSGVGGGKERTSSLTASTNFTTIDLSNGNVQLLALATNTTVTIAGATPGRACSLSLYLRQDATGGHVVTWHDQVLWPSGIAPILTLTPAGIDLVIFETLDGGTTWFGSLAGADYR
jgi:hypothetical protein